MFAQAALEKCSNEPNVLTTRRVKPLALSTPGVLVDTGKKLNTALKTIASEPSNDDIRSEKQRLIDARTTVRKRVGEKRNDRSSLTPEVQEEFRHLDMLSRASSNLATLLGSGSERLQGDVKNEASNKLIEVSERFLHYWTLNRLEIDFNQIREDVLSDEAVDELITQFDLFDQDREKIRASLSVFISDQEMRALSGPLATVAHRLASQAGVRSLKPVLDTTNAPNQMSLILRAIWYMDVEPETGKHLLKSSLQGFKGTPLVRFVIANHLMWRVFWHHWQLNSRSTMIQAAKTTLKPLGLKTSQKRISDVVKGRGNS